MLLRQSIAAELGGLLLGVAVAIPQASAHGAGAEDPFALPANAAATLIAEPRELIVDLVIDGVQYPDPVRIARDGVEWSIWSDDAVRAGLVRKAGSPHPIPLGSLRGAHAVVDTGALTLVVTRNGHAPGNAIDLARTSGTGGESRPLTAIFLDYDLSSTLIDDDVVVAGLLEARAVRGPLSISNAATLHPQDPAGKDLVRLDSAIRYFDRQNGFGATLGDFISLVSPGERAVRMAGFQIFTDFALRPDLIIHPLPELAGRTAVPTAVDLVMADRRFNAGHVEGGAFAVRNIPVNPGRGAISVVTRDILGREQIETVRYYAARDLLAPGLSSAAFNLGFVRRNFGLRSNDYGMLAGSGFWRAGITRNLTAEISAEAGGGMVNFGLSGTVSTFGLGELSVEGRVSRFGGRNGGLLRAAFETIGSDVSLIIDAQYPVGDYSDVARAAGDPPAMKRIGGTLSLQLGGRTYINLNGTFVQTPEYDDSAPREATVVGGSLRTLISDRFDVFVDVRRRDGTGEAATINGQLGLSLRFGTRTHAQLLATSQRGGDLIQAGFARPDVEPGDIGYNLQLSAGELDRVAAGVAWRSRLLRLEADAEAMEHRSAIRGNARGTLIVADGRFWSRNRSAGGYAIVRTGNMGGIPVLREHRPAGVSDGTGRLLIENVAANVGQTFGVDEGKLPADAIVRNGETRVRMDDRSVSIVPLDVVRWQPRLLRLVDERGRDLPVGTQLVAQPSRNLYPVGIDGAVEINAAMPDTRLDGAGCEAAITPAPDLETTVLVCRTSDIVLRPAQHSAEGG